MSAPKKPSSDKGVSYDVDAAGRFLVMLLLTALSIYALLQSLFVGTVSGIANGLSSDNSIALAQVSFWAGIVGPVVGWTLYIFTKYRSQAMRTFALIVGTGTLPLLIKFVWCGGLSCSA
ncbi:hypothetical protein NHF40_02935 [Maricaulaceae bacterium EIL42A08]|nr:hypothetical protein [Maricaulaceae bacterium EIL42A08]